MNLEHEVNKINEGFVDLGVGSYPRPFFVPAAAGAAKRSFAQARRTLPPAGEGRGVGGDPYQGIKNRPPYGRRTHAGHNEVPRGAGTALCAGPAPS